MKAVTYKALFPEDEPTIRDVLTGYMLFAILLAAKRR